MKLPVETDLDFENRTRALLYSAAASDGHLTDFMHLSQTGSIAAARAHGFMAGFFVAVFILSIAFSFGG